MDSPLRALRRRTGAHLPLYTFLAFFLLTWVIGNILFVLPTTGGGVDADVEGVKWNIDKFDLRTFNTPGFWALLALPLVLVPAAAFAADRALTWVLARWPRHSSAGTRWSLAEIPSGLYVVLTIGLHLFCVVILERGAITSVLSAVTDQQSSIDARFLILERVGFAFRVAVNSILPFLVVYALVRALREGGRFWPGVYLVNLLLTAGYLVALNMKWPLLVFGLVNALALYAFARTRITVSVMAALVLLGLAYAGIWAFTRTGAPGATSSAAALAPRLFFHVVLRMAGTYPWYFDEFTRKGAVCGTLWDRIGRRSTACAPSTYIYRVMAPPDYYLYHRGTAPAAVTISGYALGGWPSAVVVTALAGLVLGGFAWIGRAREASTLTATVWIMGAQVAYFLTQLPFEGPLVYDHGALWWSVFILLPIAVAQRGTRAAKSTEVVQSCSRE